MENKIINGNCIDIMKSMPDNSFDYGFTSPPYNRLRNDKYSLYTDKIDDYFKFLCDFTGQLKRLCKRGFFVNVQKTMYNKVEVMQYIGKCAKDIQEVFIWNKNNPMPASGNNITNAYEFFLYFSDTPPKEHKAVMKQEVADYYICNFFESNSTVIDPFFGLGTTGIACLKNKCFYTGIELVKEYCEMAEKRIKDFDCQLELF